MLAANLLFSVIFLLLSKVNCIKEEDVVNLPNVTFKYNFKQYSGYLNANSNGTWKFFYWVMESQRNPAEDPLLLWLNGGPGCSSLVGAFTELGPFYLNRDSSSFYENVFSWNKHANLLFIESPIGTGFSYDTANPKSYTVGDDETAEKNYNALHDFFKRVQPKYAKHNFFIAGESYAGIYIPTLAKRIVEGINSKQFPNVNFKGMAIGNGYMNVQNLTNSLMLFYNYHGLVGVKEWNEIKNTCCAGVNDIEECDFFSHMDYNLTGVFPRDKCSKLIAPYYHQPKQLDQYDLYEDCYKSNFLTNTMKLYLRAAPLVLASTNGGKQTAAGYINYDSTDNQDGYPCYGAYALSNYLNKLEVMKAIHVDEFWIKNVDNWIVCNQNLYNHYPIKYWDTTPVFEYIFNNVKSPFQILIYNGDVDTVCNFLGDAWLMRNIAARNNFNVGQRRPWFFRNQIAGYGRRYDRSATNGKSAIALDVLTVKGAGHFVPNSRPGPGMQMMVNFLQGQSNYSSTNGINVTPQPASDVTPQPASDVTTSSATSNSKIMFSIALLLLSILMLF